MLKTILGLLLVWTSIFDAVKYSLQARRIYKAQSSKNISRKFLNFAITNDVVKLAYGIVIPDWYIIISSILALGCMIDMWIAQYIHYPYRCRYLHNFKRPSPWVYFINSLLPNRLRKRL